MLRGSECHSVGQSFGAVNRARRPRQRRDNSFRMRIFPRIGDATSLESALTRFLQVKSFGMSTCKKKRGGVGEVAPSLLPAHPKACCHSE